MGLLREALRKGNGKIRGLPPSICAASPAVHAGVHVSFAALMLFGAMSPLDERPCRPAVRLRLRALGVLPA